MTERIDPIDEKMAEKMAENRGYYDYLECQERMGLEIRSIDEAFKVRFSSKMTLDKLSPKALAKLSENLEKIDKLEEKRVISERMGYFMSYYQALIFQYNLADIYRLSNNKKNLNTIISHSEVFIDRIISLYGEFPEYQELINHAQQIYKNIFYLIGRNNS